MGADNVLDELKVVVSLDPSKFKEGQDKLLAGFQATKGTARKTAEDLESSGKQASQFFDLMTDKALRLGSVLLGGVGIKDLIQSSIAGGAATGYMAKNIGISSQELVKLQGIVRQVGGDANSVGPALLGLSQALTAVQLHGRANPELVAAFQYLGIYGAELVDQATGKLKTLDQLLPQVQKGLAALAKEQGQQFAVAIGGQIGLSPDLINAYTSPDYQKNVEIAERLAKQTERQTADFQRAIGVWGDFKTALDAVGKEMGGTTVHAFDAATAAADKMKVSLGALGTILGGLIGAASLSWLGPIGMLVGGIVGATGGSAIGIAAGRTHDAISGETSDASRTIPRPTTLRGILAAPGNRLPEWLRFGASQRPQEPPVPPTIAPDWTGSAGHAVLSPEQVGAAPVPPTIADTVFAMIQRLEGAKADSKTATNDPSVFAYGKNQITLKTARGYDSAATPDKLLDPAYNDALARKIEADYIKRYNGDRDAIAIAYHNGQDAADRFVQTGGTSGIANWGPESQAYLERERALASSAVTNTSTSTANVNTINVNAPKATDSAGIAASIREELAKNALLNQANTVGVQ